MDMDVLATTVEPEKLKPMLAELINKIQTLEESNKQLQNKYQRLLEQFKLSQRKQFGSSSEKNPAQIGLFDEPGKPLPPEVRAEIDDNITVTYLHTQAQTETKAIARRFAT